jgi:hypothetical protein
MTAVLAFSAAPALATSAEEAVAFLNQQRAANGIPPVPLDQSLLRPECTMENHHVASMAVTAWSATASPWSGGPLHQSILYDPTATGAAYGEFAEFKSNNPSFPSTPGPWACMWFTWNAEAAAAPGAFGTKAGAAAQPAFYAFVSERGPSAVPAQEVSYEWPGAPAEMVGLPQGATTGPNLLVYALHMGASHIVSASLTSAAGTPVEVRTVDGGTYYQGQPWFAPWRGDVIPVSPLAWSTLYNATVVWADSHEHQATQTFSFTTEPEPPPAAPEVEWPLVDAEGSLSSQRHLRLRITRVAHKGRSLRLTVSASKVLFGRHLTATIRYPTVARRGVHASGRRVTRLVLRTKTVNLSVTRRGPMVVELRSGAFTAGATSYPAAATSRRVSH